ncbi:hypothetical protein LSAT2_002517, partial [Lamellibrachia satsuma]
IDIAALQETRLEGQGTLQEKNHTFFWIGKEPGIRREAGVGFAIANSLVKQLPTLPTGISERLITLRIPIGKTRYATVISAYAPTMTNPDQAKEEFYELLGQTLQKIPSTDKVIILGDFNARVGDDSTSWPIALGKFGRDKSNSNIYGPQKTAIAPVRNAEGSQVFTEKPEIVSRWREYFSELLNRPTTATEEALAMIEQHPTQEDIANPPTLEEIVAAIKSTKSGKTPGLDGLPAEIYKYGGEALHTQLLKFYRTCWTAKELPQQFKDALIIAIYKKKGDRSDCGNYRGISLLSTAGKILAKILLKRLQTIAELILPESQCGFRTSRSTIDMIFTLRQLQEKAVEQQQSLYMIFIDLSKAFDTVDRSTLWILLRRYGCPETFVKLIQEFHDGMAGSVSVGGTITDPFEI